MSKPQFSKKRKGKSVPTYPLGVKPETSGSKKTKRSGRGRPKSPKAESPRPKKVKYYSVAHEESVGTVEELYKEISGNMADELHEDGYIIQVIGDQDEFVEHVELDYVEVYELDPPLSAKDKKYLLNRLDSWRKKAAKEHFGLDPVAEPTLFSAILAGKDTHGGHIFGEYYESGLNYSASDLKRLSRDAVEGAADYYEDEPENDALKKIVVASKSDDPMPVWRAYFEWYPSHGEYAGLVVGSLVKQEKYEEAEEILEICGKEGVDWDT